MTDRKPGSKKARTIRPNRAEWDFSEKQLPNAEVVWCHACEDARQDEKWINQVLEWRRPALARTFDEFLSYAIRSYRSGGTSFPEFYMLWPEWPQKPYLSVSLNERRVRWRKLTGTEFSDDLPLRTVDFDYLFAHRGSMGKQPPRGYSNYFADAAQEGGSIFLPKFAREIVAFEVDWARTNNELGKRFAEWLLRRRKEHGIQPRENRGESAQIARLRAELKALGAWRLLQSGMNSTQAFIYTQQVSGEGLFANHPSAWSRAKRNAEHPVSGLARPR